MPRRSWIILVLAIILAVVTTAIMNNNHTKTDSTKIATALDIDNGDLKINWSQYPTTDIKLSETITTITESGTYHITGSLDDGAIVISANTTDKVRLILDNVTLKHDDSPVIYCYKADDLVIELVGENTIEDGEYAEGYDEDQIGAIYANADLTFQGDGTLNLISNYGDAIIGKDDIKFNSGTYHITAADDGIRGKDSIYVVGGNLTIDSAADCLKSTNETDTGKGFILIENGNFNLTSNNAKGIKSTKNILITDGNFTIKTYDDAIHSNNYAAINGGTINITAGDDGIHADRELIIDDGDINISRAYEGLEAQAVTINNGDISLTTNDDGINAGGGADQSSKNRPGANPFDADENCVLTVNNGNIYINSTGDGIDSNGWLYFNGGTVTVDGPTNNGNGALDAGMGIVMNGGAVLAIGSSGMAETLGNTSSINNIIVYLDDIQTASTNITITNSNDETILEHTAAKQFDNIVAGSDRFTFGNTYILYLDGKEFSRFTFTDITTTIGNPENNFNRRQN